MIDAVFQLQSEILTACLIKNMRLLQILFNKLLKFTEEIIGKLLDAEYEFDVCFDREKTFQTIPLLSNVQDIVKIRNNKQIYAILITEIQVFTQVCGHIGDSHLDIRSNLSDTFIKIFMIKTTPMQIRMDIVNFFVRTLKQNIKLTQNQLDHVVTIVHFFGNLLQYKVHWISKSHEVFEYDAYSIMKEFLKEIFNRSQERNFTKEILEGIIGFSCLSPQ